MVVTRGNFLELVNLPQKFISLRKILAILCLVKRKEKFRAKCHQFVVLINSMRPFLCEYISNSVKF